jgi:hypothetical protein
MLRFAESQVGADHVQFKVGPSGYFLGRHPVLVHGLPKPCTFAHRFHIDFLDASV